MKKTWLYSCRNEMFRFNSLAQFREIQLYSFFFTVDNLDAVDWRSRKEY